MNPSFSFVDSFTCNGLMIYEKHEGKWIHNGTIIAYMPEENTYFVRIGTCKYEYDIVRIDDEYIKLQFIA